MQRTQPIPSPQGLEAAKESGDQEAIERYSKRTIKVGAWERGL